MRPRRDRGYRYVQRHLRLHVLQQDAGALAHAATPGRSTREADGTILGEGLGMLVLKRLDDAQRDGDRIYAVIRSIGTSSDGKGQAVYAPSAAGQAKALRRAYDQAGIAPDTVELVEAHGTGTKVGDATELAALEEVYGRQPATAPLVRPGVGEVADRAHQGRGRCGGPDQGGAGASSQGAAPDLQGRAARSSGWPAATRRST